MYIVPAVSVSLRWLFLRYQSTQRVHVPARQPSTTSPIIRYTITYSITIASICTYPPSRQVQVRVEKYLSRISVLKTDTFIQLQDLGVRSIKARNILRSFYNIKQISAPGLTLKYICSMYNLWNNVSMMRLGFWRKKKFDEKICANIIITSFSFVFIHKLDISFF